MTTRYFKAILEAVPPSHSYGERRTIWGIALDGQVAKEQAEHIGLIQGLGKNKVIKIVFYKTGYSWFNAHNPKKYWLGKDGMPLHPKRR